MKTLNCSNCKKKVKVKKIPEYHFDIVGLPNVYLINIEGYKCVHCKNTSVILPNYGQLMATITRAVVFKNESYSSYEIDFLKKFFGLKGKEIANKLGTSPKTFSFWVTGKTRVSPAYGIKLRQFFSEEFGKYLENNSSKLKGFVKEVKKLMDVTKSVFSEREVLEKLKAQAKIAAKGKMNEAELFGKYKSEDLIFKIPNSNSGVALRY